MRDIVLVPTYDRPEYLYVCLERLFAAEGIGDKRVLVFQDSHEGDGVLGADAYAICEHFGVEFRSCLPHGYFGNSYSVLGALKSAYESGAGRVYLVEDDVFVMRDFFLWHDAIMVEAKENVFVSCASAIKGSLEYAINGPEVLDESVMDPMAYHLSNHAYSSIGPCFHRRALQLIVSNLCDQKMYDALAPGVEQDILIKRLMRTVGGVSLWPYVPRCFHLGWYGYHRRTGMRFNGTLLEKINALRAAMCDQRKINSMALMQTIVALPTTPVERWWDDPLAKFYRLRRFR